MTTLWLVCRCSKHKVSVITGIELARNYPSEQDFVNNYSVNSTFALSKF